MTSIAVLSVVGPEVLMCRITSTTTRNTNPTEVNRHAARTRADTSCIGGEYRAVNVNLQGCVQKAPDIAAEGLLLPFPVRRPIPVGLSLRGRDSNP